MKAERIKTYRIGSDTSLPEDPFVALVPGVEAPLLPLDLPQRLTGQARLRVAQRQIADQTGQPPEATELRPFAAKPHATAWTHAIVTAPQNVAGWRDQLAGQKPCLAILPDYLGLPITNDLWTIHTEGAMTQARLGLVDGFSAEHALAIPLLADTPPPKAILRQGPAQPALDEMLAALGVPICTTAAEVTAAGLTAPRRFAHHELGFDLAQNPKAAFEALHLTLRAWRTPVLLGVLAIVLWSAGSFTTLWSLQDQALQLRTETTTAVRQHFVPAGPILDIRTQVSRALTTRQAQVRTARQATDPMSLFRQVAEVIAPRPATMQAAGFTNSSGLSLTVLLPDFAALDQLVSAFGVAGLAVSTTDASAAETGGVIAVLAITAQDR